MIGAGGTEEGMKRLLLAGIACIALSGAPQAQTLRIAMAAEPTAA